MAAAPTSGSSRRLARPTARPEIIAAWVAGYLVVGIATALLQPELGQSPWYPPTAVGIAFLLLFGRRWWPLLVACELVIAYLQYRSFWPGAISAVFTVGEELAAVSLLRWRRFDPELRRPEDVLRIGVVAAVVAGIAALVAVPLVRLTGFENDGAGEMMRVWFVGEVTGVVVFLPFLLLVVAAPARGRHRILGLSAASMAELTTVALAGLALVVWSFNGLDTREVSQLEIQNLAPFLLCLLPVLWIAIRFGRARTAAYTLAANVVAIVALSDLGSTAQRNGDPEVVAVQVFMLVMRRSGRSSMPAPSPSSPSTWTAGSRRGTPPPSASSGSSPTRSSAVPPWSATSTTSPASSTSVASSRSPRNGRWSPRPLTAARCGPRW
jgi:integral membrane sensor domain MASE1